jgi:hypothetical protein
MARWKLIEPHYLNAIGGDQAEWEHKETNSTTGRQARVVYKVPRYLDPKDPADHNHNGDIVVCHVGKGQPRDIIFEGPPTPAMEPIDDEATAISDAERPNWHDPINEFSAISFQDRLMMNMQEQIARIQAKQDGAPTLVPAGSVSREEFVALQTKLAELMEQNAQLQSKRRL